MLAHCFVGTAESEQAIVELKQLQEGIKPLLRDCLMAEPLYIEQPLKCPKSGQLLGHFISAFRLDDAAVGGAAARHLSDKKAQRYFAGEWLIDQRRQEICSWVSKALVHSKILGDFRLPTTQNGDQSEPETLLAGTIYAWLHRWDSVFQVVASRWPHADQVVGGFVFGRQVVIDLALRWAAAIYLTGAKGPTTDEPDWCKRSGGALIIKHLLDERLPNQSLDERANVFGVDPRTLDRWLQQDAPLVPSEGSLAGIAQAFADGDEIREHVFRVRLRQEYGLFLLHRDLAAAIGWEWTTELGKALRRLTRTTLDVLGDEPSNQSFLENQALSFMNGIAFPLNALVLDDWLKLEDRMLWSDDIRAARDGRLEDRLTGCFRAIGTWHSEPVPDFLKMIAPTPREQRALREIATLAAMNDNRPTHNHLQRAAEKGHVIYRIPAQDDATRISNRLNQAMACMQQGDHDGSLVHWARLVGLDPSNATHRFFYGACLWQARKRKDFDKAMEQLEESCCLAPDWDRPFVEMAIIWANRGIPDQALFHLQKEGEKFRPQSDHFNWAEGVVLRLVGRLDEALVAFERAIELNPKHGQAFDLASECAFRLGDKVKGRRYAKKALDLGYDQSHRQHGV